MSRSQPTLQNPAKHFFEWKGGTGTLEFYDKEQEKRINVPLPFSFLPLDQLATITGYNSQVKGGYYSNEVRNTAKEPFVIKLKGGVVSTGLYKNDQGVAQIPKGAGYAKSIYLAHKTKTGEYIIGNFKAAGSALGAWIEFNNKFKPETGKVTISRGEVQQSPVGEFYPPVFKFEASTPEEDAEAVRLDRELQIYLSQYLSAPKIDDEHHDDTELSHDDDGKATPEQVARFEQLKAEKLADKQEDREIQERVREVFDEPINLDDIPF